MLIGALLRKVESDRFKSQPRECPELGLETMNTKIDDLGMH